MNHRLRIRFFGSIGDRLGRELMVDAVEAGTVADLRARLAEAYPDDARLILSPTLKACVDDVIVDDAAPLSHARSVEFFPPLSGG